jgi:hypothetical protein
MKNRRSFLLMTVAGVMALGVVVGTAIADELFGVITKVDVAGKKLTVLPKDEDKEIEVAVTDNTEVVTKDGASKIDLEKLQQDVQKRIDAGKKGRNARITHENRKASRIEFGKKKAAANAER